MSVISNTAVSFFDKFPQSGRYFLYISTTIAIAGGTGYMIYKWINSRIYRKDLYKRRNTVELRKPPKLWNTAIFFPDYRTTESDSKTAQLLYYFQEAKISIQICIYNSSLPELENVINEKHLEGLLVEIIVANEHTAATFRKYGIRTAIYPALDKEHLMHHKFVIIDGEAVMTGSLNWTLDGITSNRENVVISTDSRHVKKFQQEFFKLWKACERAKTIL